MHSRDYEFAVIGGGSAGYAAASLAASKGLKTVVIEGGPDVGGLCILRGCMPSKTLIESANRFLGAKHAGEFGLQVDGIGYDAKAIVARKNRLIGEFADYRREQLLSGRFDFLRAFARFEDAHTLHLSFPDGTERSLSADYFLISTGSEVRFPDIPGLREAEPLISDDILDLTEIPASVIVLGAGPVALELAHYLGALGSQLTILQRSPNLLTGVDPEAAKVVETAFRDRGATVHTGCKLVRVERDGTRRRVVFEHEGETKTVEADAIFQALGRQPRTSSLHLGQAGITTDRGRIEANLGQQTAIPHIFAAGDCTGPYEIVHIAVEQGELAVRNILRLRAGEETLETRDYRLKLYAVFTDPEIASVGLTEAEAAQEGRKFLAASYPFNDHGKSLVMDEVRGFVKLVVDEDTREIIGATVVGPHASDLIHEIVVAMAFRSTAGQLALIPHYHPTLSEIWTYPAAELAEEPSIGS